jgi:DNA-binding MarR family transcriptional regulator
MQSTVESRITIIATPETPYEKQQSLRFSRRLGPAPAASCRSVRRGAVHERDGQDPRQYAILATVSQNPDVSQTGLVEQTGVDRSTLADIVRRLVKKGLLQRKRTRRDARMYAVRLTQKGQNALNAVKPAAARVDQRLLSALGTEERGVFIGALGEIVRAMNRQAAARR